MAKFGQMLRDFVIPLLVLLLGGVVAYDHLAEHPSAGASMPVDGKALGKKFVGPLGSSFGSAWLVAADSLEQGKSVADAQAALQSRWQDERASAFATLVTPGFARVLPEGTEPTTPAQRAEVVKLWRDFATGLKGGR